MTSSQTVPLRSVCVGIYDGPHATPKPAREGPIYLGIGNITERGGLNLSETTHVSPSDYERWTRRVTPQAGDLVFTYEATLHRYALIPEGFSGCLGRRVGLVRPDPSKVHPRYLLYHFLSRQWRSTVESWIMPGATVDRIPIERFPDFPITLPPLAEQQYIADKLAAYDELIDNNRRRMALLEDAARQLYREWFVRLRFPGHETTEIVNSIPEGWRRAVLREICAAPDGIQTGPFGSQLHQSDYVTEGIPVVMPKDMKTSKIDERQVARVPETKAEALVRHRMRPGDIVYGRRGEIGRRALISQRQSGWLCGTGCLRLRVNARKVLSRFLFDTLGHPDVHGTIAARAQGATLPNLSAGILSAIPVALPPMELQQRYESIVKPMTVQIETLALQSDRLHQARDLLLPRLMRGELQP